jgi:hypothetical protein
MDTYEGMLKNILLYLTSKILKNILRHLTYEGMLKNTLVYLTNKILKNILIHLTIKIYFQEIIVQGIFKIIFI